MAKKKRKGSTPRKTKQPRIDHEAIREVEVWFERIVVYARRATELAQGMSSDGCRESNDVFWALVKYAENVQESIKAVDNINKNILPALSEIPIESANGETAWADLKGMRERLVHKFWDIDPGILWSTVSDDLPKVVALLSGIKVHPDPIGKGASFATRPFQGREFLELPYSDEQTASLPGHALLFMRFEENGNVEVLRMAKKGESTMLLSASSPLKLRGLRKVGEEWRIHRFYPSEEAEAQGR